MALPHEQKRVNNLILDSTLLLCKSGLTYTNELKVQGVIGLTVDEKESMIHVNETYTKKSSSSVDSSSEFEFCKPMSREERKRDREKHSKEKPAAKLKDEVVDLTESSTSLSAEQQATRTQEKVLVRSIITETVGLVCRNSITYKKQVTIAAVIGVTVDTDVFLVHVAQALQKDEVECMVIDADSSELASTSTQQVKEPSKRSQSTSTSGPESKELSKQSKHQKTQQKAHEKQKDRNRPRDEEFVDLTETTEDLKPCLQKTPRKTMSSTFAPQQQKSVRFTHESRKRGHLAFTPQPFRASSFSTQYQHRQTHGKGPYSRNVSKPQRRRRVIQCISDSDDDSPPSSPNRRPTTRLQTNSLPKPPAIPPRSSTLTSANNSPPPPINGGHTQHTLRSPTIIHSDTYQDEAPIRTPPNTSQQNPPAPSRTSDTNCQTEASSRGPPDTYQQNDVQSRVPSDTYPQNDVQSRVPDTYQQSTATSRIADDYQQSAAPTRTTTDTSQQNGGPSRPPPRTRYQEAVSGGRYRPYHLPTNRAHIQMPPIEVATVDVPTAQRALSDALEAMNEEGGRKEGQPSGRQVTDVVTYSSIELETENNRHPFSDDIAGQNGGNSVVDQSTFRNEGVVCIGSVSSLGTAHSVQAEVAPNPTGYPDVDMEASRVTVINCDVARDKGETAAPIVIDIEDDAPTTDTTTTIGKESDVLQAGTGNTEAEMEVSTGSVSNCNGLDDMSTPATPLVIDLEDNAPTDDSKLGKESEVLQPAVHEAATDVLQNDEQLQQRILETQALLDEPYITCKAENATDCGSTDLQVATVEGNSAIYDKLTNLDAPMEGATSEGRATDIKFRPTKMEGDNSENLSQQNGSTDVVNSAPLQREDMKPCSSAMVSPVNQLIENLIVHPVLQKQEAKVIVLQFTWQKDAEATWKGIVSLRLKLDDMASRDMTLSFFISTIFSENVSGTSFPSIGYWVVTRHPDFDMDKFTKSMKSEGKQADMQVVLTQDGEVLKAADALMVMLKDYNNTTVQQQIDASAHEAGIKREHRTMRIVLRENFFKHLIKKAMKRLSSVGLNASVDQIM